MSENRRNTPEDHELILRSRLLHKCRISLFEQGLAPWAKWETELYSVGRCIRQITGYSRFLPIFLSGDHGVNLLTKFWESEKDNFFGVYLTSSTKKYDLLKNNYDINVLHIKHPWIAWLERNNISKSSRGAGILVFLPHTTSGVSYTEVELNKYLHQLTRISKKFGKITICISYYDINKINLRLIYNLGFEVETVGNPRSINFVENFYKLIDKFEYATSPKIGSQTFFCLNFGLKYFLYGEIELSSTGLGYTRKGAYDISNYSELDDEIKDYRRFIKEIRYPNIAPTEYSLLITAQVLGLSAKTNYCELKKELDSQLKKFWWYYLVLLKQYFNLLIRKIMKNS